MKINFIKAFYSLLFVNMITSCNGQTKPLSDSVLELENFDFSTSLAALLPDTAKDKEEDYMYKVKNTSLLKEVAFDNEFSETRKPVWFEYRQFQSRNNDELMKFGKFKFNTFNIAATLENKIMVINGLAAEVDKKDSDQFIQSLNKKYGEAELTKGAFMNEFDIYTWKLKDRIIKYILLYDNESGTMNLIVDKEKKTIENGKKRPHYKALFYIINGDNANVIGKFHTGDLLYCQ